MTLNELTHFNKDGRPRMVDVSSKESTLREASAEAIVHMNAETYALVLEGKMKKGDVLAAAQTAGIMGAKRTSDLIPMCHNIIISGVDIAFETNDEDCCIRIISTARCKGETGVEMEALCAVSVAALTIYDMCKAVQRDISIGDIRLLRKSGGKSGDFINNWDER